MSYYTDHKEETLAKVKEYAKTHKDKIKEYQERYRELNKEKNTEYQAAYRSKHIAKSRAYAKQYQNDRLKNDADFRLSRNIRARIRNAIHNNSKSKSSFELLGCTMDDFKKHIESQFKDGMTWDNWGRFGWHIDHIKPCALFNLRDPEQQKQCFHYTNLQPLWALENQSKGKKYDRTC